MPNTDGQQPQKYHPQAYGKREKVYEEHIRTRRQDQFLPLFSRLWNPIPDEYLELMAQALTALDSDMHTPAPPEKSPLVKI